MPRENRGPHLKLREQTGFWEIIWYERGQRRRKGTGTGERAEADKALGKFLLGQESSGPCDPSQRRIADVLNAYVTEHAPGKPSEATIGYSVMALLGYWGDSTVSAITKQTCKGYAKHRGGMSNFTIRRELATLSAAIGHDFGEGRLTAKAPIFLPSKPDHKDRWLTRSEAAALLRAARADKRSRLHLPLFILLGLYTGARKEAILDLRWPQVDLERRLIDFNPPGRERTGKGRPIIPIPSRLMTFLRLARKHSLDVGHVISYRGAPISNITHGFSTACRKAKLAGVSPHVLRHTSASWMVQAGVPFPVVARYLGHADSRTTELIYSHHAPDYLAAASASFSRRSRP